MRTSTETRVEEKHKPAYKFPEPDEGRVGRFILESYIAYMREPENRKAFEIWRQQEGEKDE